LIGAIHRGNEISAIVAKEFDPKISVKSEMEHWEKEAEKAIRKIKWGTAFLRFAHLTIWVFFSKCQFLVLKNILMRVLPHQYVCNHRINRHLGSDIIFTKHLGPSKLG